MKQGFTEITHVLVIASSLRAFQQKFSEIHCKERRQALAVVNNTKFMYVSEPQQMQGYSPSKTRYLELFGSWEKKYLLDFARSRYSHLSEQEWDLIQMD